MKLSELLTGIEYEIQNGSTDIDIKCIHNDSRKVKPGDLFFCISGAVSDGHSYSDEVQKKGAAALVVEKDVEAVSQATIVKVKSTRYAMGVMSSNYYGNPSGDMTVIGITGTKGKTTTTYMIKEMLDAAGHKCGLIGTNEIYDGAKKIVAQNTTPESIHLHRYMRDMLDNGLDSVVMEVSSQGLMLDRVAGVGFDYGIFTNLSKDHIGPNEHKDFDEYKTWKTKLFSMCKCSIINADDEYSEDMEKASVGPVIKYGMKSDINYYAKDLDLYFKDGVLGIQYKIDGDLKGDIVVDLPGEFSVHNSLAAVALADMMKVPFSKIKDILIGIKVRGRVEMIPISDEFTLMIDYAHNAMALSSLLEAIKAYKPGRIVTLFGCGGNRSRDRRFEMGEVSGNMSDFTIITSDNPRNESPDSIIKDIITGIEKTAGKYIAIPDRKEAIRYAIMNAEKNDVIILAGKGHEDYQEINGIKHHMDERELIREILEEEDVKKICGYNNRYFA